MSDDEALDEENFRAAYRWAVREGIITDGDEDVLVAELKRVRLWNQAYLRGIADDHAKRLPR